MQVVKYDSVEKEVRFEKEVNGTETFNINALFNSVPLSKALVKIHAYDKTVVSLSFNTVENVVEEYTLNINDIGYFDLPFPNNQILTIKGNYKITIKVFRI